MVWMVSWCSSSQIRHRGLLESKGYCFPCQHLIHSHGASSNAFNVFYAAATALEMPVWNTVVIPTLVLIHITIINCDPFAKWPSKVTPASTFPGHFNVVPFATSSACLAKASSSWALNVEFTFGFFFCGLWLSVGDFAREGPWDWGIPKLVSAA